MDRVVIVGGSCSGKSTLGRSLAERRGSAFIELDALHWLPGWREADPETFRARVSEATAATDHWVVAGNYISKAQDLVWGRATAIVWLDLPLRITVPRLVRRSWLRWRRNELLWGTNREQFWRHLKLWDETSSLLAYTLRHHRERRATLVAAMADPAWAHLHWIRLTSRDEVTSWQTAWS